MVLVTVRTRCNSFKSHERNSTLSFCCPTWKRFLLLTDTSWTNSCGLIYTVHQKHVSHGYEPQSYRPLQCAMPALSHRVLKVVWTPHLPEQLAEAAHEERLGRRHLCCRLQEEVAQRRDVRQCLDNDVDVVRVLEVVEPNEAWTDRQVSRVSALVQH